MLTFRNILKQELSFGGSGGVRKLRWALQGRGNRGGVRIIYYLKLADGRVWLLTMYAKNVRETIPAHVLRQI